MGGTHARILYVLQSIFRSTFVERERYPYFLGLSSLVLGSLIVSVTEASKLATF